MTAVIQLTTLDVSLRGTDGSLSSIAYQLERDLTGGPMPRILQDIRDAFELAPVATADQVRWRHAPCLDGHPVVALIAEALDGARLRVAVARSVWPPVPVPIAEQCAALGRGRADLRAAANLLLRAKKLATGEGLVLAMSVVRDLSPVSGSPMGSLIHTNVYVRP